MLKGQIENKDGRERKEGAVQSQEGKDDWDWAAFPFHWELLWLELVDLADLDLADLDLVDLDLAHLVDLDLESAELELVELGLEQAWV